MREYIIKVSEEEVGTEFIKVSVPQQETKDETFANFEKAKKYIYFGYFERDLDENDGIEEYDEYYSKAVENGFSFMTGLERFLSYLEDFCGYITSEILYDFEIESDFLW